jgi:hypothetical protein
LRKALLAQAPAVDDIGIQKLLQGGRGESRPIREQVPVPNTSPDGWVGRLIVGAVVVRSV